MIHDVRKNEIIVEAFRQVSKIPTFMDKWMKDDDWAKAINDSIDLGSSFQVSKAD